MGQLRGAEADAWLRAGGLVVTASERASRALLAAYHNARRSEGLKAWAAPNVLDWQSFARREWEARTADERLVLTGLQEQRLWSRIAGESAAPAAVLDGPRRRLAAMAMDAHALLCGYAPRFLDAPARSEWQQEGAAFNEWLARFEEMCRDLGCMSASRVPLLAIEALRSDAEQRPALLLYGFDRLTPVQRELFDAWGNGRHPGRGSAAERIDFYAAADGAAELRACVAWCREKLTAKPDSTLLVIAQDVAKRRGEMERAMLEASGEGAPIRFEFSLGMPLSEVNVARTALLLLRWMDRSLEEREMDWLFSTGHAAETAQETEALQAAMHRLRNRCRQRPEWMLGTFIKECSSDLPVAWVRRMSEAHRRWQTEARHAAGPMEWAELAQKLLVEMAWQQTRTPTSAEFQATRRWQQGLEACGSLGFDGRAMTWREFAAELESAAEETLFAPESDGAAVVIAGSAESAGLLADGIWFLGAQEDAWPARGATHPLLSADVQRKAGMPHATPQLDWEVAHAMTARMIGSAPEVVFSLARQVEGVDARPSRLVMQIAGAAEELPAGARGQGSRFGGQICRDQAPGTRDQKCGDQGSKGDFTEWVEDLSRIPFSASEGAGEERWPVRGGAAVLTAQSNCPFKAFATVRLGAKAWDAAEPALTPMERGQLLHAVLETVWNPGAGGIRSLEELRAIVDLSAFVTGHVETVMKKEAPQRVRGQMGPEYLELEERRLTRVVTAWLELEKTRAPFTVEKRELEAVKDVAGLMLRLRLDRLDRLNDGTLLVVDYKSGDVSAHAWDLPRMSDVQLPLYARFGLEPGETLGGLVFAKVRPGEMGFAGRVGDAVATLLPSSGRTALAKDPMTIEELMGWEDEIAKLARDFLDGDAKVDPIDPKKTCTNCGLQALCRINERGLVTADDEMETKAGDE